MDKKQLDKILANHQLWRGGDGGERANLDGANLEGANLDGAKLAGARGNMRELKSIFVDPWPVTYTSDVMQIGCERHEIKNWWKFDDEQISKMDNKALEWWRIWKPILKKIIKASPARPTK